LQLILIQISEELKYLIKIYLKEELKLIDYLIFKGTNHSLLKGRGYISINLEL
jgi:hypothetical protein